MTFLSDVISGIASVGALEARRVLEGVLRSAGRHLLGLCVIVAGLIAGLGAIGLFIASAFLAIAPVLGPSIAALLTGVGALMVALATILVGARLIR